MRVLCADDSAIMRKIIREAVDILGFDLVEAKNGEEALEIMEKEGSSIELILLDWNMPDLDGYQVLTRLKADERFKEIPVMMVTTEGEKKNIVKAIQSGAKHYVTKPFNNEELAQKILECLGLG